MATVYVGAEKQKYMIPKDLICHASGFFKTALESSFKEGLEQTVYLPEDTVEAFDSVVGWVYSQKITPLEYGGASRIARYLEIALLADRLDIYGVSTTVAEEIRILDKAEFDELTSTDIDKALGLLRPNPIRELFASYSVDLFISDSFVLDDFKYIDVLGRNDEFSRDILIQFLEMMRLTIRTRQGQPFLRQITMSMRLYWFLKGRQAHAWLSAESIASELGLIETVDSD